MKKILLGLCVSTAMALGSTTPVPAEQTYSCINDDYFPTVSYARVILNESNGVLTYVDQSGTRATGYATRFQDPHYSETTYSLPNWSQYISEPPLKFSIHTFDKSSGLTPDYTLKLSHYDYGTDYYRCQPGTTFPKAGKPAAAR